MASEDVRRLADWGCSPTVGESPTTLMIGSALVHIYVYEKIMKTTHTSATAQVSQWWNWGTAEIFVVGRGGSKMTTCEISDVLE